MPKYTAIVTVMSWESERTVTMDVDARTPHAARRKIYDALTVNRIIEMRRAGSNKLVAIPETRGGKVK